MVLMSYPAYLSSCLADLNQSCIQPIELDIYNVWDDTSVRGVKCNIFEINQLDMRYSSGL
jgi:hypothetical protein